MTRAMRKTSGPPHIAKSRALESSESREAGGHVALKSPVGSLAKPAALPDIMGLPSAGLSSHFGVQKTEK
jgi:hypothetical protein